MTIRLYPGPWRGTVQAIPSKSDAHRKLIAASLSQSPCVIELLEPFCGDIAATIDALRALGARIVQQNDGLHIQPIQRSSTPICPTIACRESGTTLRLLLPIAASICESASFNGFGRLPKRPLQDLMRVMEEHGVSFSSQMLPFSTIGRLYGGTFALPGDVSSQYISGLLFSLPNLDCESQIVLQSALESSSYIKWTCDVLRQFGVQIHSEIRKFPCYCIKGNQAFIAPARLKVVGDWSNAVPFLIAGALSGKICVNSLPTDDLQGDCCIVNVLRKAGVSVIAERNCLTVSAGKATQFDVDMRNCPDLLPVLAIFATFAKGQSRFYHAGRLRLKECDRLTATARLICDLGGKAIEKEDELIVTECQLQGGAVDCYGDHRMVMAASIASIICKNPVTIRGAEAIGKSYPLFFSQIRQLGANWKVIKDEF